MQIDTHARTRRRKKKNAVRNATDPNGYSQPKPLGPKGGGGFPGDAGSQLVTFVHFPAETSPPRGQHRD